MGVVGDVGVDVDGGDVGKCIVGMEGGNRMEGW